MVEQSLAVLQHSVTVTTGVKSKGDILSFSAFKEGQFEPASKPERASFMTTMLTDVATALWSECQKVDDQVQRRVIQPNGFSSASFVIEYEAASFRIEIHRDIRSFWFIVIPGLAERPASYKVTMKIRTSTPEVGEQFVAFLRGVCADRKFRVT
jgi:hypothetical protein